MHSLHPELTRAMAMMLDRIDASIRASGYSGEAVRMFLAGGMAVHYYCGTRYTEDVDASFSHRLLLPIRDLTVDYQREDGSSAALYFDANYNDHFALMHPDYRDNAVDWEGIGNERRLVHLKVLAPLDLAVSKIARATEQDYADIMALAGSCGFTAQELKAHASEALDYYVGDTRWINGTLDQLCTELSALN